MRRMMLDLLIPSEWKHLWNVWDLRGLVILSLSLHAFLTLFAPLRKQTSRKWIIMPLGFAYVLADWVANFVVVFISYNQGKPSCDSIKKGAGSEKIENAQILAFWASFIFMRIGGPDTITAFVLEDNELWLRHLFGLVFQCLVAVYVFVQSLPHTQLWIPTMLMLMTGIIKYAERTRALYLASARIFKGSILTDVDLTQSTNKAKEKNLTELQTVQYGFQLFKTFKGLVVDAIFTRTDWNQSREFFLNRTAKDAFKVVEVELNFIYDVLFTKLPVVNGYFGGMSWFFSFTTDCLAIVVFMYMNKTKTNNVDVRVTYGLLFGALALDIIALFMLVFSDHTIISLRKLCDGETQVSKFLSDPKTCEWLMRVPKRRWCESISAYNLIYHCLHPQSSFKELVFENLGMSGFLDEYNYVKTKRFNVPLKNFIFMELKSKSKLANDWRTSKDIRSLRGDGVLGSEEDWSRLLPYIVDIDYYHSILLWHIATELCFNKELIKELKSKALVVSNNDHREIANQLSGYMMYLYMMQPQMMTAIAGKREIKFQDTCGEARKVLKSGKLRIGPNEVTKVTQGSNGTEVNWEQISACRMILAEHKKVTIVEGVGNNSVLFDSCNLANKLMKIEDKWLVISKVWVELLCYGASHSQANIHATQVSRGGELITIVWLLMAHFGFSNQFEIDKRSNKS